MKDMLIAAKAWRTDGGGPLALCSLGIFRKAPQKPDVRIAFKTAQGVGISVLWCEDDATAQRGDQPRLAWNAEFGGEVAIYVRNGGQMQHVFSPLPCI